MEHVAAPAWVVGWVGIPEMHKSWEWRCPNCGSKADSKSNGSANALATAAVAPG
jgi:transposase